MLKACTYKVWFCLLASVFVAIATTVARLVVCPASSSSTCSNITVCTTSSSSVRAIPLTTLLLHYWGASLTPLLQRKRLRCKENQRNRISESIRRRCFQHRRLTSLLNQEILTILSKFTQYSERNYSVLQEVKEFDVRAKLCKYNR